MRVKAGAELNAAVGAARELLEAVQVGEWAPLLTRSPPRLLCDLVGAQQPRAVEEQARPFGGALGAVLAVVDEEGSHHLRRQPEHAAPRRLTRCEAGPQRAADLLTRTALQHAPHTLQLVDLLGWRQPRLLCSLERADSTPQLFTAAQTQPQLLGAVGGGAGTVTRALPCAQVLGTEVAEASKQQVVGQLEECSYLANLGSSQRLSYER
mmetsp:Transcript_6752/g.13507  ORF Transcript_6752/g.13507 Transcript_6752/m.13507 type:complete len:209 (+) Transcript_6752:172-798(+)